MIYGIGNPLIDIIVNVEEEDLVDLGIHKGTMALINTERMEESLASPRAGRSATVWRLMPQHHHRPRFTRRGCHRGRQDRKR